MSRLKAPGAAVELLWWLATLVTAAWVPWQRHSFIFQEHPPKDYVWSDMNGYVERAMHLADPGTPLSRFDTFYPPGTHILMAPLFRWYPARDAGLLANQSLWWVLAVLCVWAVGWVAWLLYRHPAAAALSMLLLMKYQAFTVFTGFYMSESPFSCFMMLSLGLGLWAARLGSGHAHWRSALWGLAGLCAGVTTTVRPQFALGAALMGLPLLSRTRPFVRWRDAVPLFVCWVLPLLAAIQLQRHAAGAPVGLSSNGGFNFYQGHCKVVHVETHQPGVAGYYVFAAPVSIQRAVAEGRPEIKAVFEDHMAWDSEFFYAQGWTCIQQDGWSHLGRVWTNLEDLFGAYEPWPVNSTRFNVSVVWGNVTLSHAWLFILPLGAILARWRRPERWLLLQIVTLLPMAIIFYGDCRYRIPYDIFVIMMGVGLLLTLLGWRKDPRQLSSGSWQDPPPGVGPYL